MAAALLQEQLSAWGCGSTDEDVLSYVAGALEALAEDGAGQLPRT
jgi:hypothetical protein